MMTVVCLSVCPSTLFESVTNCAFTRYDRRTDWSVRPRLRPLLLVLESVRLVSFKHCLSDQSDRPLGQTVAEPPTSVNQINVAC